MDIMEQCSLTDKQVILGKHIFIILGCGKTHTMMGIINSEEDQGIIPRTFSHTFLRISQTSEKIFLVSCSFIEIYNEEIRDLLGRDPKAKYELKELPDKGVFVKDLTKVIVKSQDEIMLQMDKGNKNRTVGATAMNA